MCSEYVPAICRQLGFDTGVTAYPKFPDDYTDHCPATTEANCGWVSTPVCGL